MNITFLDELVTSKLRELILYTVSLPFLISSYHNISQHERHLVPEVEVVNSELTCLKQLFRPIPLISRENTGWGLVLPKARRPAKVKNSFIGSLGLVQKNSWNLSSSLWCQFRWFVRSLCSIQELGKIFSSFFFLEGGKEAGIKVENITIFWERRASGRT